MLIRALIVLLLVLNLGVGLWWATRPTPVPPATDDPPRGVARLQLVSERGDRPPVLPAAAAPVISQCVRFGPFTEATAATAQSRLRRLGAQVRRHRDYAGTARSWKVLLPPADSMAAAETAASRIAEAGFSDWFVIREGEDARSVALGLYRNEAAARERAETLQDAGFAAELVPVGAGPARHWVDAAAPADFDAAGAQILVAAPGREPIDCAAFAPATSG